MLKSQDCVILIKLIARYKELLSQRQLANELGISLAAVNAGIKRLSAVGLLRRAEDSRQVIPILAAVEEFLLYGVKYLFPGKLGSLTRGTATAVGAPVFKDKIILGDDPLPVWPDAQGDSKGLALEPIHPAIPRALREHPDPKFYELLTLVDALRQGRAREKEIAKQLLKQRLK